MSVNITGREQAEALIHDQLLNSIFQDAPKQSVIMQLGRKLPNMTSKQTRVPVLSMLPMSYWVNGDTGMKKTSRQAWENVYLTAGELAVIVPIPEAVLDDASFDIIGEITPRINEAIGQAVDAAIAFGVDRPSEWQNDLITLARQAGNNVAGGITYDTLLGEDGVFSKVEKAGYSVDAVVAAMSAKAALRAIKDDAGRPIFMPSMQDSARYALDGAPIYFPENGSFDTSVARMLVGNFNQLVYSIRQDVTVKILDQGVIQDPSTKEIVYNLAQQDMIALRVVFRMGWALPNPATRLNADRTQVPFAYIDAATAYTDYAATFTVKDDESTPLQGAQVNLNGAVKKTGSDGTAVFNLRPGDYPYSVKMSGHRTQTGLLSVTSKAEAVELTLPKVK